MTASGPSRSHSATHHGVVRPADAHRLTGRRRPTQVDGEAAAPGYHQGERPGPVPVRQVPGGGAQPAGDQGHLLRPGHEHGQRHLGRTAPSARTGGPPPRAGSDRRPSRTRCRWGPPPPIRRPGRRRPAPTAPRAAAPTQRAGSPLGHQHAQPPGQVPGRPHRGEARPAGGLDGGVGLRGASSTTRPPSAAATHRRRPPPPRCRPCRPRPADPGAPPARPGLPLADRRLQAGVLRPRSRRAGWTRPGRRPGQAGRQGVEPRPLDQRAPGRRPQDRRLGQRGEVGPGDGQRVGRHVHRPHLDRESAARPRPPGTGRWPPNRSPGRRRPGVVVVRRHLSTGGGHPVQHVQGDVDQLLRLRTGDQHPAVDVAAPPTGTARCPGRTATAPPPPGGRPVPSPRHGHRERPRRRPSGVLDDPAGLAGRAHPVGHARPPARPGPTAGRARRVRSPSVTPRPQPSSSCR